MSIGYRAFMADTSVSDSTRDVEDARETKALAAQAKGRELADARFQAALDAAGYAGWCLDLAARDSQWAHPEVEIISADTRWPSECFSGSPAHRASWAFESRFASEDAAAAASKALAKATEKAAREAAEFASINPFAALAALKVKS